MARVILNPGEHFPIASGADAKIFGTGQNEEVSIQQGANVEFKGGFNSGGDSIQISGDSSDYQVKKSGTSVSVQDDSGNLIKMPVTPSGIDIGFNDQSFDLRIDTTAGSIKLGDQKITDEFQDIGSTTGPAIKSADVGTASDPAVLDASGDDFKFTDDATVKNAVEIQNFAEGDTIEVSNAAQGDYSFSNDGQDVSISYNNTDAGVVNQMTLMGVVDSGDLVYNQTSFESAIGFDAFSIA